MLEAAMEPTEKATDASPVVNQERSDKAETTYRIVEITPIEPARKDGDEPEIKTEGTNKSTIAVQANDYDIERQSGRLPGRRRLIPLKFRDYQTPGDEEDDDDDYRPTSEKPVARGNRRGRRRGFTAVPKHEPADYGSNEEESYRCNICNKKISSKGNLKVHLLTHTGEKPFRCNMPECDKSFRSNESLKRHKLAHMGIKLFECEICKEKFSSNISLKEHILRHSDSKPLKCQECGRQFRQSSCLARHVLTHSSQKPFPCDICGRKFSQKVYLRSHLKVHTGERPFECKTCQKRFAHQSDLKRHQVIHTGQKPYACSVCGERFSDSSSRRRHEREHTGSKPYSCQLCGDTFTRAGHLKTHLNKKHVNMDNIIVARMGPNKALHFEFGSGSKSTEINDIAASDIQGEVQLLQTDVNMVQQAAVIDMANQDSSAVTLKPSLEAVVQEVCKEQLQPGKDPLEITYQVINTTAGQVLEIHYDNNSLVPAGPDTIAIDGNQEAILQENLLPGVVEEHVVQESVVQDGVVHDAVVEEVEIREGSQQMEQVQETGHNEQDTPKPDEDPLVATSQQQTTDDESTPMDLQAITNMRDFINKPDFNSQEYYNWLSSFTELCKLVHMPLDLDLFQKISQVQKTLADVLATPTGVLSNKENFRILMEISRDLGSIINEHHSYILQSLDATSQ